MKNINKIRIIVLLAGFMAVVLISGTFITGSKNKIYAILSHEDLYYLWEEQKAEDFKILHLDFHDDLRNALIDREAELVYKTKDDRIDCGNFLTHAIFEGMVNSIRWVHDIPGGREDSPGGVIYRSDLSETEFENYMLNSTNSSGISLQYDVVLYDDWQGLEKDEYLDIDWDVFACTQLPKEDIEKKMEEFLGRDFKNIPKQTYVTYSLPFSHDSLELYDELIDGLAKKFNAEVIVSEEVKWLPESYPWRFKGEYKRI